MAESRAAVQQHGRSQRQQHNVLPMQTILAHCIVELHKSVCFAFAMVVTQCNSVKCT